ncbi:phage tail tape measure protein [Pengzhenrongella frigida]|nr:phage tail tape measure protein [Cellulomonas sp. HLT2-17]
MVKSADENSAAWTNVGTALLGIGVAAGAGVGLAISKFADFDQAMSNVKASTHETTGNMDLLRAAAMQAGAETQYSATEAAGAMDELAKAGISTTDVLAGGLDGALSLAAAGAMDVGQAAEIAATALNIFNLEGSDVPHVADLLAAGAGKAQGSVEDMGMALKQAGLVASQTGLSIEETTGGLAAFASAGLIGSDAGTSFKAMLSRLTPQSAEAQKAMDELGISAYDSGGNFVGLSEFAGNLQTSMKDLTPEARNAAMSVIFGSDAVRAASVLYNEGATGVEAWTEKVNDQGYAAETAALKTDNLRGDLERLGGAFDTALIQTGSSANAILRDMTQNLTGMVDAFGSAPEGIQGTALAIGGTVAAVGLLGGGFLIAAPRIVETSNALKTMGLSANGAKIAMSGVGAALTVGLIGVTAWATAQGEAAQKVSSLADALDQQNGALTENSAAWISAELTKDQSFGINNSKSMVEAAEQMGVSIETLTRAYEGQPKAMAAATSGAKEWMDNNFSMSQKNEGMAQRFITNIEDQGARLTDAKGIVAAKLLIDQEATGAQDALSAGYEYTSVSITEQVDALTELIGIQSEASGVVMSERDAQRGLQAAIDDATASLEENGKTLDITTEKGRANQAALDGISESGWKLIESMRANGSSQAEIQAQMGSTREAFLLAADAMGMGAEEAGILADQLGLIPANVVSQVTIDTENAQRAIDAFLTSNANHKVTIATGMGGAGGQTAYADGGYTGDGAKYQPAGIVHKGEVVIKASSAKKFGVSNLLAINARGYAEGGLVGAGSSGASVASSATFNITEISDPAGTAAAVARRLAMMRAV